MSFKVMNAKYWNFKREAKGRGNTCAYQQCACQARALGVGNCVEVIETKSGGSQYLPGQGQYTTDVVPGGKLGHNATILAMHFRLRVKRMAEQSLPGIINRYPGFIA